MSKKAAKATLDPDTISAIANQVGAQLQNAGNQSAPKTSVSNPKGPANTHPRQRSGFLWGAASGVALAIAAPLLGSKLRPAAREVVKGGIRAGRYVRKMAATAKEEMEDIAAEASSQLEEESKET
jgi:hypothetical protein